MTQRQIKARLAAIDRWERAARIEWIQGAAAQVHEHPTNFQFGFVGTWTCGALLGSDPGYRIMQSSLTAWWQVMTRCIVANLDPERVRTWLDQATGRHYAEALITAALGVHLGPFEFQVHELTDLFRTNHRIDPVLCIAGDPDSVSAHAQQMIASLIAHANGSPQPRAAKSVIH